MPTEQIWLLWVLLPPRRKTHAALGIKIKIQNSKHTQIEPTRSLKMSQSHQEKTRIAWKKLCTCKAARIHRHIHLWCSAHSAVQLEFLSCLVAVCSSEKGTDFIKWPSKVAVKALNERLFAIAVAACKGLVVFQMQVSKEERPNWTPKIKFLGNDPVFLVYLERGWIFAYTYIVIT